MGRDSTLVMMLQPWSWLRMRDAMSSGHPVVRETIVDVWRRIVRSMIGGI
jgi:hypothetical protein